MTTLLASYDWEQVFDFTSTDPFQNNDGGFVLRNSGEGQFQTGIGWQSAAIYGRQQVAAKRRFAATTLVSVDVTFNRTCGGVSQAGTAFEFLLQGAEVFNYAFTDCVDGNDQVYSWSGDGAQQPQQADGIVLNYTAPSAGRVTLTHVVLRGTGVNPFTPTWSQTFDFTLPDQGFTIRNPGTPGNPGEGHYVDQTGWASDYLRMDWDGVFYQQKVVIKNLTAFTAMTPLLKAVVTFDRTCGNTDYGPINSAFEFTQGGTEVFNAAYPGCTVDGANQTYTWIGYQAVDGLRINLMAANSRAANQTGAVLIKRLTLYGIDPPPFPATATPTATPTPTLTPTATPTFTPTFVPTPSNSDANTQILYLQTYYGVYLEDTAQDGDYDYWRDITIQERVSRHPTRVDIVYRVVTYLGETLLSQFIPDTGDPGQRFKMVFGNKTTFRYTGNTSLVNAAAETQTVQKTENIIILFNVTNVIDRTDTRCGSVSTGEANLVDITRCTITHELGHVLIARAYRGILPSNYGQVYDDAGQPVFGQAPNPQCSNPGQPQWDPGEPGWPWREHRITGGGTYNQNLCKTAPAEVIREFEADMIMNYILDFFAKDGTDLAQVARFKWTRDMMGNDATGWVYDAKVFTNS